MKKKYVCSNCKKEFLISDPDLQKENDKYKSHVCLECVEPDWERQCFNCEETPIVPVTGMCGPCTFGEAETAGGNW